MTSTTFWSRVWRISSHPSPQKPQVLSARFIIQGRNSYIESRLVIAPTGQICTQPPQNSQSNWCPAKCTISVIVLRPALPSALTSMTWSQYHAAQAGDAAVHLLLDQRAEELLLIHALGVAEDAGGGRVLVREVLEVAAPTLVADRAVERMVRQDEFQHGLVGFVHDGRVGPDHHGLDDEGALLHRDRLAVYQDIDHVSHGCS